VPLIDRIMSFSSFRVIRSCRVVLRSGLSGRGYIPPGGTSATWMLRRG